MIDYEWPGTGRLAVYRVLRMTAIGATQSLGPSAVGLHLLTGDITAQKFANMLNAVSDGRLAPSMIVARKS
jgi:hypothetical protein